MISFMGFKMYINVFVEYDMNQLDHTEPLNCHQIIISGVGDAIENVPNCSVPSWYYLQMQVKTSKHSNFSSNVGNR